MPRFVEEPQVDETDLPALLATWSSDFARIRKQATAGRGLVDSELEDADSEEIHEALIAELDDVHREGLQSLRSIEHLAERAKELRDEWRAARRYQPEILERRLGELTEMIAEAQTLGAREWLNDIFDALDALEGGAAQMLSGADLGWPDELAEGARSIAAAVKAWNAEDYVSGAELMEQLAEGSVQGWEGVLAPQQRSRAHRLAAWVFLRRLKKPERAEAHLNAAVKLYPYAGRMHAERAAYYLSVGDLDQAVTDAQRAIELAADDEAGYWELGIWAELSGDFDDADILYRKALALLATYDVARIHRRASIMDPPGRLLIIAADILLREGRPSEALEVTDRALRADLRGTELHPRAAVHRLRSLALERTPGQSDEEAAAEAVQAGKLYIWNGDPETGIKQFTRAASLHPDREDVGWLLADAFLATSLPLGEVEPDPEALHRALSTWNATLDRMEPPRGDTSWAYLTRAIIADLGTQVPGANRLEGVWEALFYVEKALVHDRVDAQRWGYAAQYLRYVHLDELAFECADRGYRVGAGDRQVLVERLPRLVNDGKLDEAEEAAELLVSMFGNDPWVSAARAWLALHSDRPTRYNEALRLLDMPLSEGNDPSWYYEMRALCHAALGEVKLAQVDCTNLLNESVPVDGTTKCRMAVAAVCLGRPNEGVKRLKEGQGDPTSRAITCLTAHALLALSSDDLDRARSLLAEATEHATSEVELTDIVEMMRLRLPLLDGDPGPRRKLLDELEKGPVAERALALREDPPTADGQLEEALAQYGGDSKQVPPVIPMTLAAIKARRELDRGDFEAAAASYEAMLGTSFEPEATMGLTDALKQDSVVKARAADVEAVRRLQDRLSTLGDVTPAESTIALAAALERAGKFRDARQALEIGIEAARTDSDREELQQRAGGLALAENKLDRAARHFRDALESAKERDDHGRIGQLEIRLALISLLNDDRAGAVVHLIAAVRAWRNAGALEPAGALLEEVRGLAERPRQGKWRTAAKQALELIEAALDSSDAVAEVINELDALRRELDVTIPG